MAQQSIEDRLSSLEKQVSELKQELVKRRTIDGIRVDIQELRERYEAHEVYVSERFSGVDDRLHLLTVRLDALEDHMDVQFQELKAGQQELRSGQQALQAGQDQILAILTRQAKTND